VPQPLEGTFFELELAMTTPRLTSVTPTERLLRAGRLVLVGGTVALAAFGALAEPVDGEIKKIDTEAGKITLKHGEIKSLDMPAMQMAYRVSNPAWLKGLNVGDKVNFSADKVNGQFTITAIEARK
jgi:Cu(I)/Ag(I) efflux system protein CusF